MNKLKKTVLALLLTIPMFLNAGGIGFYVPYSIGASFYGTNTEGYNGFLYNDYSEDYDSHEYDYHLKNKAGIGIAFDTNLAKDRLFSYRLGVELSKPQGKYEYSSKSSTALNFVNTFGFHFIRTDLVNIWAGPRVNIGYEVYDEDDYWRSGIEIGIAPAIGININVGDYVTLTFDIDYKFAIGRGEYEDNQDYTSTEEGNYKEQKRGATVRFGVFYRFGESNL